MNPNPSTLGDVKLSYRFISLGLVGFLSYIILFYSSVEMLEQGIYRVNSVWTLAHVFILGFLIMVVMGVMYQLIPVALLVSIYSDGLSRVHFWVYAIGVIGLSYSLWQMNTTLMLTFGSLAFLGVILFVTNILLSTKGIKSWNMMSVIIVTAVLYLFLTVLFGLGLVLNFRYGTFVAFHDKILFSHITFGLIGWLTTLIIGFSYKMVPMFALAHGYSERYAKWIFLSLQVGIGAIVAGLFAEISILLQLGLGLLGIAFLLFTIQIKKILQAKMKTNLDIGFKVAVNAVYFTIVLLILSPILIFSIGKNLALPLIYLFLNGWIGLSILGYLYKIIPFLWWTDKYSDLVGKEKVPMLKEMIDERRGKWAFILIFTGMLGNTLGIALGLKYLMLVTNSIYLIGGLLYSYLALRIFKM